MKLPNINLPKLDKKRVKALKKQSRQWLDNFKRYLPLLLAFGLGLIIGLVQDRPGTNVTPSDQTADVQELDLTGAEEFSDRMVGMLRKSQCSQMYSETSLGFRANASEEQWLAQCSVAASVLTGEADEIEKTDSNLNDDVAEFSYRIQAEDDKTYIVLIQAVNRDGAWKLQGINSQVES